MYKKILVAYDNSEAAKRALEAAIELVEHDLAKKILILMSYEPLDADPTFDVAARLAGNMNEEGVSEAVPVQTLRDELTPMIEGRSDIVDTFVTRAKPQEAIPTIAQDNGCDLIVMGRRGVSGLASLGSVSKAVLANSTLPVLLVH